MEDKIKEIWIRKGLQSKYGTYSFYWTQIVIDNRDKDMKEFHKNIWQEAQKERELEILTDILKEFPSSYGGVNIPIHRLKKIVVANETISENKENK